MSAINVLRQTNSVSVLTDGAAYNANGIFMFPTTKVVVLPHLNAVIAGRGPAFGPAVFSQVLVRQNRRLSFYCHCRKVPKPIQMILIP
jgi:hypothetical protein